MRGHVTRQQELHPTSWQYPLINYFALSTTAVISISHNSVDMALNSKEEVQLFDWELLQQEIDGYISMKNESCDKNYALCFQDKEDQSLISEEK